MIAERYNTENTSLMIYDSFVVAEHKLNYLNYKNICCSISGGSDSDIMLDLIVKSGAKDKVKFIWFDTGLEYQATKDHLKYLEEKYDIQIETIKPIKPIPLAVRKNGQPFISKQVSEMMSRLQRHNFKWENESFDSLIAKYPNCKAALKWWCNMWGENSKFNISYNKYLKEFIISNPPNFKISNKCCHYTKKDVARKYKKEHNIELSMVGVRKAEGGSRSTAYKNCFTNNDGVADEFRPIFWYKEDDKRIYEHDYNIKHSRCYTDYGLTRTGCAGCPFGRDFEFELDVIEKYEPKLFKAVNKIFGDSYEYTRNYRKFCEEMNNARN